ncbi:FAD-dependent monooxygenase [Streptomyces sp. NPDC005355]|uniref:FAD-dependent oxidoreductase n=1 Tax=Streptomyces sp. NPDC005355 TaxID=3157038 RepID=UPI0033A3A0FC
MRTSLVLGGGIAGLLAARVLSDHADEVVIVEPDDVVSEAPARRRGVPQSGHSHILLGRGREILGQLFPGLFERMIADGAQLLDFERDGGWFVDGLRRVPVPGDEMLSMSRPFLEWHLRRAVLALPGLRVVTARVRGLTITGNRVDGVLTGGPGGENGQPERIAADLVVDASGRNSRLCDWLTEIGYQGPPRIRVGVDIGYATCFFHREPGQQLAGFGAAHSMRTMRYGRPGASSLNPVEGDRWMALTTGFADDRPGRGFEEFTERCLADPAPPMHELVRRCEPIGDVAVYRFPASMRRDFHRLSRFPAGLVALGDAVASFNPVYGQGMTSAALHARALGDWLRSVPDLGRPAGAYFGRITRIVDDAWQTSAAQDRLLPHVASRLSRREKVQLFLRDRLIDGAVIDTEVHRQFLDVVNMRARPRRLMRPSILMRALCAPRRCPVTPEA